MLRRGDIAQKVRAIGRRDCAADGRRDVIVSGGDIRHQRPKDIERRSVAEALFHLHIGRNLIHRHMARSFHHHLHVLFPGTLGQVAEFNQLPDLPGIRRIVQATRTQGVSQADGHVILSEDVHYLIIILIEGVLIAGHLHPSKQQGAPAGYNVHFAL